MEAWQIIKDAVDSVQNPDRRKAIVQHLRAVGYNNLHPQGESQSVWNLDARGKAVRRKINKGLGTEITKVSKDISELLATISLNNDEKVFFATQ